MATTRINAFQQFTTSGDFSANNFKLTNLATPVSAQDAATKAYVDNLAQGLNVKAECRVTTTANITLSGTQTIDGITLSVGDRVLVKNQTTSSQNGIYVVASGAWTRSTDADNASNVTGSEVTSGMFTFISEGTNNATTGWVLSTPNPITLGTTALTFVQFSGAGTYSANNGVQLVGSVFSAVSANTTRIAVGAAGIDLAAVGSVSGTYGNTGYQVPNISVDGYGRFSAAANRDIFGTQNANLIFGGPSTGAAASPTFRSLALADMIVGLATGATTATLPTNGQLLIGNATNFTLATLTNGTGVTVTNAAGSITIAIGQSVATVAAPTFAGLTLTGALSGTSAVFSSSVTASSFIKTSGTSTQFLKADGSSDSTTYVINAGGNLSSAAGILSARPASSAAGKFYYATDTGAEYYDNGTTWDLAVGALTGDVTSSAKSNSTTVTAIQNKSITLGTGFLRYSGTSFSFITGTSSQFIKADGSLDSNTYLTSSTGVSSITGTANQIIASSATGAVTLSLPQNINIAANVQFATISLVAGTVAVSTPILSETQTWNAAGVTFIANLLNITDTASAITSKLLDLQVNSTSVFSVRKDGVITVGGYAGSIISSQYGGTGVNGIAAANGTLLIGNGAGYTLSTLTATASQGILITNGAGSIAFAADNSILLFKAKYICKETPTGTTNAVNATFTVTNLPVVGSEMVFTNGILQQPGTGNDYTISGSIITFLTNAIPQTGDKVLVTYISQ